MRILIGHNVIFFLMFCVQYLIKTLKMLAQKACINEDIDMVKFLVDKGIDVNMRDNEGWTALHAAAQSGFIEIAK